MNDKNCYDSIVDVIGHTPLVRLNHVTSDIAGEVFAKLEFLNPMGSSKDRIARHMIAKAEKEGKIKKGDLIIENSSGNTAMGLALIAIQKGYRLKVVVRDRISREKLDQLKALGVEIHMVDSTLPPESPDSYNNITSAMVRDFICFSWAGSDRPRARTSKLIANSFFIGFLQRYALLTNGKQKSSAYLAERTDRKGVFSIIFISGLWLRASRHCRSCSGSARRRRGKR